MITKTGHRATSDWLLKSLPTATFAHLATHGQFQAEEYALEQQRLDQNIQQQIVHLGSGSSSPGLNRGFGVRNPLGYVGIVMANANQPTHDNP